MGTVARIEGAVQRDQYCCAVVADTPWNERLRAAGLGPRHPATCECAQCEEQREEADAAYSDPAYEEMNEPAERSA